MAKILISPSKYVQGPGEMKQLGSYAAAYGKKALVLISKGGYKRIGSLIEESFASTDCAIVFDHFNGECSRTEINRLTALMTEKSCDLVIGGLPVTLKELGIEEVTDEKILAVAEAPCAENATRHNMPFDVTPQRTAAALKAADAYGHYYLVK